MNEAFPYDVYLDMHNELNDPNLLEWNLVEKYSNLLNIKNNYDKGVLNNLTVYVPLKLWCDQSINSAIPAYLLKSKTNPLNIIIQTKTKAQIQIKKQSSIGGNIFDNPDAKIEEIKLMYDEHTFTKDVEQYLNQIYNSTNNYNVFFDKFEHQINTIPNDNTVQFPSNVSNKQRSRPEFNLKMSAPYDGPLREIIFLFRNKTQIITTKGRKLWN